MFMLRRAGRGELRRATARVRAGAAHGHRRAQASCEQMANHCSAAGAARRPARSRATTSAPGSSRRTRGGTGRVSPPTSQGDALSSRRRGSRTSPKRARCSTDSVASTKRSRWSVRAAARTSTRRSSPPCARDPVALFDGIDEDTVDEFLDAEPVDATDADRRRARSRARRRSATSATSDAPTSPGTRAAPPTSSTPRPSCCSSRPPMRALVRRAAFVHDVGRFGVPGSVWDKPGAAHRHRRERMRLHVYYVERIFNRPEPLRRIGLLAATHHERMDGSGYHRGVGGDHAHRRRRGCSRPPTRTTR